MVEENKKCPMCGTPLEHSFRYNSDYCPICLYWVELIQLETEHIYPKYRPKYPINYQE